MRLSVARMFHDQQLAFYRRGYEDFRAALEQIVRIYGDDSLSNGAAQDLTFDVATQALAFTTSEERSA